MEGFKILWSPVYVKKLIRVFLFHIKKLEEGLPIGTNDMEKNNLSKLRSRYVSPYTCVYSADGGERVVVCVSVQLVQQRSGAAADNLFTQW